MSPVRTLLAIVCTAATVSASCARTDASPPARDAGPPAPTDAGASLEPFVAEARVTKLSGVVEVRHPGSEEWSPLEQGAVLKKDDEVRTGGDGSAELDASGNLIELTAGTDVRIDELTQDLTRYLLGAGLISANATAAGAPDLQLNVAGTDVEVRSSDGRFRMSSNGKGTVAVGAQEGSVAVSSLGKSVVLKQGERTLVTPGKGPSAPEPLATSMLLKVAWPSDRETNKRRVTVTGRTAAGALVFAMGQKVNVGADGTFRAQVALREGENALQLRAMDVSGNVAKEVGPRIQVDTHGAASRFKTDNLWGK